jgi:uncharacterized protein YcfL
MKTGILLAFAGTLLLAVSGCKSSMNTVENAQKTGQRQMLPDQRAITDQSLAYKVSIVGVNSAMTPGGFLKVQIELLNNTRSPQPFNYQFEWFDANGMQITTLSPVVVSDVIQGGEDKFVSAEAPTMACRDFRVKFIRN